MNPASIAPSNNTLKVWDLPTRLFHWALVAAIAVAFLSSEEDSAIAGWHMAAGWVASVLIVFRLVWGFIGGQHARFANFVRPSGVWQHLRGLASGRVERTIGHNPAGALAVLLMLGMIAAVVVTGYQLLQGGEEDLHETIAWGLLGLIVVHVAAVIATSVLSRENLVRAMVTGRKNADHYPEVRNLRRASPASLLLALGIAGVAAGGILSLDPQAFSNAPREGAEREGSGERGEASEAHGASKHKANDEEAAERE